MDEEEPVVGSKTKQKLLKRLRDKLKLKRGRSSSDEEVDDNPARSGKNIGNQNAKKTTRKVEIGWLDYNQDKQKYQQVRLPQGGGTRRLSAKKSNSPSEMLKIAQDLFFPAGVSSKEKLSRYESKLFDNRHQEVNDTVEEIYNSTKMPTVRYYLATKHTAKHDDTGDNDQTLNAESENYHDTLEISDDGIELPFPDILLLEDSSTSPHTPTVHWGESVPALQLEDTLPITETESDHITLVLRRGNILGDMINAFSTEAFLDKTVNVRMVLQNGSPEMAEGIGVFRDALSEFWSEFQKLCTTGEDLKVPYIRHDFSQEKWTAVARIIVKGFMAANYFPVSVAPAFMEEAIYGNYKGSLISSFLRYVPIAEREILAAAMHKFPDETDEVLEVLEGYGCRKFPRPDNIVQLLEEIGHKEIIQKPMYVADCMHPVLQTIAEVVPRERFLASLYDAMQPTTRKVIAALKTPETMSSMEVITLGYLKKYIRTLDSALLRKFLRFWTGADVLSCDALNVTFSALDGFQRRPIAHTCGQVLEVPVTYDSFVDFKR